MCVNDLTVSLSESAEDQRSRCEPPIILLIQRAHIRINTPTSHEMLLAAQIFCETGKEKDLIEGLTKSRE